MSLYHVSPHVRSLPLDECSDVVGHPFFLEYSVLDGGIRALFGALREAPATPESLCAALSSPPAIVEQGLHFLRTKHFVLAEGDDEEAQIRARVNASRETKLGNRAGPVSQARTFRDYAPANPRSLRPRLPFERTRAVKVVVLGGCLAQVATQAIEQLAPTYGLDATVEASWPDRLDSMSFDGIDIVVFQPFTYWLIAPFWDGAAFLTDEERASRLATMKDYLRLTLDTVLPRIKGCLLLVHGISTPVYSPLGRAEFRHAHHFRRAVYELNQTIAEAIGGHADAMFIDEEQLLANAGKARLMDDGVALTGHHGPLDLELGPSPIGGSRREAFGIIEPNATSRLFATAYLDAFVMWSGLGRIKCVVVDLDNTLWPGVAGEGGLQTTEANTMELWVGAIGGIHQVLKILKRRGVLLAYCSRSHEDDTNRTWEQLESLASGNGWTHLLTREDFVMGIINWERKSANIAKILVSLGVAPDAALFIDDSAAEREEVRSVFPALRVLGENMLLVRSALLDDPCLQNQMQTTESSARTAMVKAQLEREAMREQVGDGQGFLRSLNISMKVTRLRSHTRLPRIVELIQRTNQFNTTLIRFNRQEVIDIMNHPHGGVYALEAADRFAAYGLVGACLMRGDEVVSFVMSCRVIPLRLAVPFLNAVLTQQARFPVRGRIVEGPRNQPCRELFRDAGFDCTEPGTYLLNGIEQLQPVDESLFDIDFQAEPLPLSAAPLRV